MQSVNVVVIYQGFVVIFNSIDHPLLRKSEAHTFTTNEEMASYKYYK